MCPRIAPSPSRAAERLKEYLDIFDSTQVKRGKTLWYDIYRRAGTQWHTNQVIKYLKENGLIKGTNQRVTKKRRREIYGMIY